MSFDDGFTIDDLRRAYERREALTIEQMRDLIDAIEGIEGASEEALEEAYQDGQDDASCDHDEDEAYAQGFKDGKQAAVATA